jgi:tRNA (guanine37-N1)-methyltransferase
MVMKPEPFFRAIERIRVERGAPGAVVLTTPDGPKLTQGTAERLRAAEHVVILCGRYEGIDERVRAHLATEEISIGDYVLSGGEIAALALIDACVRLLPGVMGKEASGTEESFSDGLLEYPQYTRPQLFEGAPIPQVLTSGDHAKVAAWRRAESEALTAARRPDLWAKASNRALGQKTPKNTTDG